jgi:manganese-dependent inorganic pyrophosphatase
MVFFMLTNIIDESTELLYYSNDNGERAKKLIEGAFHIQPEPESCVLQGVISRKKQLIPSFMTALQQGM